MALLLTGIIDDPTNASGLGTPAIIRGTVYGHLAVGVTQGSGQTLAVRQTTATGLQNALNYAINNGKFFELEPGIYEIDTPTGLQIAQTTYLSGFTFRGDRSSRIIQFHSNAPVLTIGDATGAAYSINLDIKGLRAEYGVSQSGNTSANTLVIGSMRNSKLANIFVGSDNGGYTYPNTPVLYPGYRGVYFYSAGNNFPFVCTFDDFFVSGAQHDLVNISTGSEGLIFRNWYCTNGYNATVSAEWRHNGTARYAQWEWAVR
jgi:hypothetical protein